MGEDHTQSFLSEKKGFQKRSFDNKNEIIKILVKGY